jgi:small subunit ribosomal protein S1
MESTIDTTKEESEPKTVMSTVVAETPNPPSLGDLIEGRVAVKDKTSVYVDLGMFGTGVIYGREYLNARDIIKKTNINDSISAKIVDRENEDGYIELSLKEAKQATIWNEAEEAIKSKAPYNLVVKDANKGGLMIDWQGIMGFLPASQLKLEHYPRVEDGDKDKIASELKKLIGEKITVSVITADPVEGKLIFSEKNPASPEREAIVAKYAVGDIVEGEITGAVEFGIFIKIVDGLEGLVHISEIDWSLVENLKDIYKPGDKVKAKIIEIKDGKISLSIKRLKENPWVRVEKSYKANDIVTGVVIKFNKYGALISIEEGVAGLIHISEFESEEKLKETLELGKTYNFEISIFEPKEQRMTLKLAKKDV